MTSCLHAALVPAAELRLSPGDFRRHRFLHQRGATTTRPAADASTCTPAVRCATTIGCANYKRGHSFACNGPVILLTVDGHEAGDEIRFPRRLSGQTVRIRPP